jgi:hypothetical protein
VRLNVHFKKKNTKFLITLLKLKKYSKPYVSELQLHIGETINFGFKVQFQVLADNGCLLFVICNI